LCVAAIPLRHDLAPAIAVVRQPSMGAASAHCIGFQAERRFYSLRWLDYAVSAAWIRYASRSGWA
jgi:hypothetical protein